MSDINSFLSQLPEISSAYLVIMILVMFFLVLKLFKLSNKVNDIKSSSALLQAHLKMFELTANQLHAFQVLVGQVIYRHKTLLSNKLDNAAKSFLEDVNAAIELNNQKKEEQLKSQFRELIIETKQKVANDVLDTNLAIKQLELFASDAVIEEASHIHQRLNQMYQHTDSYLEHLQCIADNPFDSRLDNKLALSHKDKAELMQMITSINSQFKKEKLALFVTQ